MRRHLDIDIEMWKNGDYDITVMEPETNIGDTYHYKAGSGPNESFQKVVLELQSWVILLDDNREVNYEDD